MASQLTAQQWPASGDLRALLRVAEQPLLVAVAGDSGSGKSTYTRGIERLLGSDLVARLPMDGYHKEDREQRRRSGRSPLDPRANHLGTALEHLRAIKRGEAVDIPRYDHGTGRFAPPHRFQPKPVVIVEGLHALYPEFLPLLDFRLYVDAALDIKWAWKIARDVNRRGYTPEQVHSERAEREAAYGRWIDFQQTNADVNVKLSTSELAGLAVDEFTLELPTDCYHIEIIASPVETRLPPLVLPVDMNSMTQSRAQPFMLANVPSSFWGKPVNVVHVDGTIPRAALRELEAGILNLAGLARSPEHMLPDHEAPSTMLFTQLAVTWPFIGHTLALLGQPEQRRQIADPP